MSNEPIKPEEVPNPNRYEKCSGCNKEITEPTEMKYIYKKGSWHYCCMRRDQCSTARGREEAQKKMEDVLNSSPEFEAMKEAVRVREEAQKSFKDSGKRESFFTGAVRDVRQGKGRYDIVAPRPLHRLAVHHEIGCIKYGDRNFENGIPVGRYLDSCMRHLNEFRMGKMDEPHLISALWNMWNAIDVLEKMREGLMPKELDDYHYSEWYEGGLK